MKTKEFLIIFSLIMMMLFSISAINASEDINADVMPADDIEKLTPGTFSELNSLIQENDEITLVKDYMYDAKTDADYAGGISINKSLTIDGNGHALDANGKARIFAVTSDITLKNINFINGYQKGSSGGAIIADNSQLTLKNCNFTDNNVYCSIDAKGDDYTSSGGDGGAIYITGSLTCTGCYFTDNGAYGAEEADVDYFPSNGGAIYSKGNLSIKDSSFISNKVDIIGGGEGCLGGAIYASGDTAEISGSTFKSNVAGLGDGGAIYLTSDLTCTDSVFINNSADFGGGAISAVGKMTLKKCEFENNSAKWDAGGAISLSKSSADISECEFRANTAQTGGAINLWKSDVTINNCEFIKNTAETGGAINTDASKLTVSKSSFKDNSAETGGAINTGTYPYENFYNYDCTVTESEFEENKPYDYGGAFTIDENILIINSKQKTNVLVEIGSYDKNGFKAYKKYETQTDDKGRLEMDLYSVFSYRGDHYIRITCTNQKENQTGTAVIPVSISRFRLEAEDLIKYYGNKEKVEITLTEKDNPVSNAKITITVNGQAYTRTTDSQGKAYMAVDLNSGEYKIKAQYEDAETYSTVTILPTVEGSDVVKVFQNKTNYTATFVDSNGAKIAAGNKVDININGVFYQRTVRDDGSISFTLNLEQGTYILTVTNPVTGENVANNVTILPRITDNHDLTKYYRNESQYTFTLIGDNGKPIANQKATININGVFYERTTDKNGRAVFQINLEPGEYILTVEYKKCRVSNTVKVLNVIKTKDLKMKYKDGSTFNVTILNGQGKALSGAKIRLNINGVFYNRTTNDEGRAFLPINLMAGQYIITTTYNGLNAANKVTVSG